MEISGPSLGYPLLVGEGGRARPALDGHHKGHLHRETSGRGAAARVGGGGLVRVRVGVRVGVRVRVSSAFLRAFSCCIALRAFLVSSLMPG